MAQFNKKLIMLGSLFLAGSVNAGGAGFDNIVVNLDTDITPIAEGEGFLQQEVIVDNRTYIQTVVIDPLTTGTTTGIDISTLAFSDITFTQMMGSASGITPLPLIRLPPDQNNVMVSLLGQGVTPGETGSSIFGFQSVNDINDAEDAISTFSTGSSAFSTASPFAWDTTNFGATLIPPTEQEYSVVEIPHIISTTNSIISTGPFTAIDPTLLNIPTEVMTTGTGNFTPPVVQLEKFGAFEPGRHLLTWQAPQEGGITNQKWHFRLDVLPLAAFGQATTIYAGEGSYVNIPVYLNGKAPSYPVRIPYTVGGSASYPEDHNAVNGEVVINSGKVGIITFEINDDNVTAEQLEEITFTLHPPTTNNAAPGLRSEQRVVITETHLPPQLDIAVIQRGLVTRAIDNHTESNELLQTTAAVIIRANNPEHKYRINWSESDNNLLAANAWASGKSLRFDPANIPAGSYKIKAKITDLLSHNNKQYDVETLINISNITPPAIPTSETPAQQSFILDNGISLHWPALSPIGLPGYTVLYDPPTLTTSPLYPLTAFELIHVGDSILINSPFESISRQVTPPTDVLIEQPINPHSPQVSNGLILKSGNVIIASGKSGNVITASDLREYGDINGGPAHYPVNSDQIPDQIVDFEVSGLTTPGQSISIVIPQTNPIPENPLYRKYMPHTGWVTFTENANNSLASAIKINGICPPPGNTTYTPGLSTGDNCIQLTIEDGGPNDADQQANSIIKDPGGVTSKVATTTSVSASSDNDSGGGGGGLNLLWLLMLLMGIKACRSR